MGAGPRRKPSSLMTSRKKQNTNTEICFERTQPASGLALSEQNEALTFGEYLLRVDVFETVVWAFLATSQFEAPTDPEALLV